MITPPDWLSALRASLASEEFTDSDGRLIGWLCKCGRLWSAEVERCICGNPAPSKRPGPRETK